MSSEQSVRPIRRIANELETTALEGLRRHVQNRKTTFSLFERLDPGGRGARDAQALLQKAEADYRNYAASVAVAPAAPLVQPDN